MDNQLDTTSLKNAFMSFKTAVRVFHSLQKMGADERAVVRAGLIQNFEFCYELCWKFMKRWIEMNVDPLSVDGVTRRELFRQAAENKLITDVDKWMDFHKDRNRTSHIYEEDVAEEVLATAFEAIPYMQDFTERLEARR
jgi:nucleotidyltransferase substrate binding protein (TIGR01987 family)